MVKTSTTLVADILPGKEASAPGPFVGLGDALYFAADDGGRGRELWRLAEPPPPAADTTAPNLDLNTKKFETLDKSVEVTVGCDEACTASATGKITAKASGSKKGKSFKLKAALKGGAKLKAKLGVEVSDAASNASADTLSVKLH
jgi:hypothetical protein